MSIFFTTTFICLAVGAGIFLYVKYNMLLNQARGMEPSAGVSLARKTFHGRSRISGASSSKWKAVKVKAGLMCCKTAEKMRGQVFLISEAPNFPLINCQSRDCQCGYTYLDDRRREQDRRESNVKLNKSGLSPQKERRKRKDRRKVEL